MISILAYPIVVLSMYSASALPRIVAASAAHRALGLVPVYLGQYGISAEQARVAHTLPRGRYAPIFTPSQREHAVRTLPIAEAKTLGASQEAFAGPLPARLLGLSSDEQRLWGLELGRRLRDDIRKAACAGVRIDAWQFDEISPTPAGDLTERGAASRMFLSGVLHGLAFGRPQLADAPMPGLVFVSAPDRFGRLPDTRDVRLLLWELDHVALALIGEEYATFRGDPKAAARHWASGQLALRRGGGVRARLAARYLPAMTPGYDVRGSDGRWTFLNGNVDDKREAWVLSWEEAFIAERVRIGVAGLAEYNFAAGGNDRPSVIRSTVAAVANGLARLLRRA